MGNKLSKQKSVLDMMDESIAAMEKRLAYLKDKLERLSNANKTGKENRVSNKEIENLQKQIEATTGQLEYVVSQKKEFEKQLETTKTKEERTRLENILKCAVMVGVVSENQRVQMERDSIREQKSERESSYNRVVSDIFARKEYRFVTPEKVEEIIQNQEFKKMAEEDPDKLYREEEDFKAEYATAVEQALRLAGMQIEDDFGANEAKLKEFYADYNGYDFAVKKLKEERYQNYTEWGNDEDKEFFRQCVSEMEKLEKETKRIERQFITGESDFKKGNGYTKELVEREQKLYKRLTEYRDSLLNERIMKKYQSGEAPSQDELLLYELAQAFEFPLKEQLKRDTVFQKNNMFREKLEMWDIYQKLPEGQRPEIRKVKETVKLEGRAWSKLQRMEKNAVKQGGLYAQTTKWTIGAAQNILEIAKGANHGRSAKETRNILKEKAAVLVLNQIIYNEIVLSGAHDEKPYTDILGKNLSEKKFNELAKDMAGSKEFGRLFDQMMKGGKLSDRSLKFLAEDMEKEAARKLPKKVLKPEKALKK